MITALSMSLMLLLDLVDKILERLLVIANFASMLTMLTSATAQEDTA